MQGLMDMKMYSIEQVSHLPITLEEAWHFFSRPENLNEITPDDMSFQIITDVADKKMHAGMIIEYKISPFAGVKMNWVTEISHCVDRQFFVDEQRFGPYAFWHHQHHFEAVPGGVRMTDIVHYGLPLGFLGRIAHALFVRKKLEGIFAYRTVRVAQLFPDSSK
jgi:ligand-binding SRPBCC domain-containing protein